MSKILHIFGLIVLIFLLFKAIFYPSKNFSSSISVYGSIASIYGIFVTIVELFNLKSKTEQVEQEVKTIAKKYDGIIVSELLTNSIDLISQIQNYLIKNELTSSYFKIEQLLNKLTVISTDSRIPNEIKSKGIGVVTHISNLKQRLSEFKEDDGKFKADPINIQKLRSNLIEIKNRLIEIQTKYKEE